MENKGDSDMSSAPAVRLPFKEETSLEKRKELGSKIRLAHPGRVPVIVERHARSRLLPDIPKRKYLAPADITIAQLLMEVRKQINVRPEEALFWHVGAGKQLQASGVLMGQLYSKMKDEDGFLYITYSSENIYG